MYNMTKLMAALGFAAALAVSGCEKKPAPTPAGNGGNTQASGEDEHGHGEERVLGTLDLNGTVLEVSIAGEVKANEEVHVEVAHTSGPAPSVVRMWIGSQSAEGALKSKADGHDNHFHGHAEAPAVITPETKLWIEVEFESGGSGSFSGSFTLP